MTSTQDDQDKVVVDAVDLTATVRGPAPAALRGGERTAAPWTPAPPAAVSQAGPSPTRDTLVAGLARGTRHRPAVEQPAVGTEPALPSPPPVAPAREALVVGLARGTRHRPAVDPPVAVSEPAVTSRPARDLPREPRCRPPEPAVVASGPAVSARPARDIAGLIRGTRDRLAVDPPAAVAPAATARSAPESPPDSHRLAAGTVSPGPSSGTSARGHARDAAEVLRMWPASRGSAGLPAAANSRDDKLAFAHLARDLYRELGELEAAHQAQRGTSAAQGTLAGDELSPPWITREAGAGCTHSGPPTVAPCVNQACQARLTALRGGLIEACLLVQRMASVSATRGDVEVQVRHLLELLEH